MIENIHYNYTEYIDYFIYIVLMKFVLSFVVNNEISLSFVTLPIARTSGNTWTYISF